jgi:cell division control protein 6
MDNTNSLSIEQQLDSEYTTVFKNQDLIKPDHIVDEDRIIGRNEQLTRVIQTLKPVLHGDSPEDMILEGHSGTGKSLIASTVTKKACKLASKRDIELASLSVNCKHLDTEHEAIHSLVRQLEDQLSLERTPSQGVSTSSKYTRLYDIIDEQYDAAILIFDEIDKLVGVYQSDNEHPVFSDVIYKLSRATRIGGIDSDLILLATTNSPRTFDQGLESRTESSFSPTRVQFSDYDAHQLIEILEHREDAFKEGTLTDDAIPKAAAFAAQGEGDARFAIDLLREAGNIADRNNKQQVGAKEIDMAQDAVEQNYALNAISTASSGKQIATLAAAVTNKYGRDIFEDKDSLDKHSAPTPVSYEVYSFICKKLGATSKSRSTFVRRLKQMRTTDAIGLETKGRGFRGGVITDARFKSANPNAIIDTIKEEQEITEDFENGLDEEIKTVVQSNAKQF